MEIDNSYIFNSFIKNLDDRNYKISKISIDSEESSIITLYKRTEILGEIIENNIDGLCILGDDGSVIHILQNIEILSPN